MILDVHNHRYQQELFSAHADGRGNEKYLLLHKLNIVLLVKST